MGKKKNKGNIWDITTEEQKRAAEEMYQFESGEVGIFDISSKKSSKPKINDNGFSNELESQILNDFGGNSRRGSVDDYKYCTPEPDEQSYDHKQNISYKAPIEHRVQPNRVEPAKNTLRFEVNDILNRIVVNDGISPTTLSMDYIDFTDIVPGTFDPDELGSIITELFVYIISCKHPFAIIDDIEFEEKFKNIGSVNSDKFMVTTADISSKEYFLLYYIDQDSREEFLNLSEKYNLSDVMTLKLFVSLAYKTGETHNILLIEDDRYLNSFMNGYKNADQFIDMVMNDADTMTIGDVESEHISAYERLNVIDAEKLQSSVRELLSKLTGDDDDDDMNDDDDLDDYKESDSNDVDTEIETVEGDDVELTIPEAEQMITIGTPNPTPTKKSVEAAYPKKPSESVIAPVQTNTNHSDDGSMVIPVIRRH